MPQLPRGYSVYEFDDLDATVRPVSAAPSTLFGYHIFNDSSGSIFVRFYDVAAASVTVGATGHVLVVGVPTLSAVYLEIAGGIIFGTEISVSATTGGDDADTTGPGNNECVISAFFLPSTRRQGA